MTDRFPCRIDIVPGRCYPRMNSPGGNVQLLRRICSFRTPRPVEVQHPDLEFRRLIGGTRRWHDLSSSLGVDAAVTTSGWGRVAGPTSRRSGGEPGLAELTRLYRGLRAQPRHPALLIRHLDRPRRSLYRRSTRPAVRAILRLIGSPAAGVCRCSCMPRAAIRYWAPAMLSRAHREVRQHRQIRRCPD